MGKEKEIDWLAIAIGAFGPPLARTLRERTQAYEDQRRKEVVDFIADIVEDAAKQPDVTADMLRRAYSSAKAPPQRRRKGPLKRTAGRGKRKAGRTKRSR